MKVCVAGMFFTPFICLLIRLLRFIKFVLFPFYKILQFFPSCWCVLYTRCLWQLYTTPIERRGCFLMCSITAVKGSSLAHRTMITTVY